MIMMMMMMMMTVMMMQHYWGSSNWVVIIDWHILGLALMEIVTLLLLLLMPTLNAVGHYSHHWVRKMMMH